MDRRTIRLLTATARLVEEDGLTPAVLRVLEAADVTLTIDWHPAVEDAWRAMVAVEDRTGPVAVDEDAAVAAARALRAAAVHGVGNDRPVLRPAPRLRGPWPARHRRAK